MLKSLKEYFRFNKKYVNFKCFNVESNLVISKCTAVRTRFWQKRTFFIFKNVF